MPKHKPRGPRPSRVRWFVRDGCVRVHANASAKREVREAMAASEAAPKSLEGSWDTTEAGKHEMGSGRKRGRDIIAGHSVDAYQVAGFFRRKAKVQKQEERKGKKLERSPQLQSWKWWGGDPMWWLAEEAIRKAEKKHGKKFGRCDNGRGKNPIVDDEGFLPIEEKDVDEYERRATDFAYALIELFEANDVPYLIKFGLKGTSAVEIYAKGKRRTTMLPSRYEFVIQTGAPLPETDVNALFESTGFDELMYYDGWESGSYGDDPQVWPSNFWYENDDGNCGWTTTGDFASKVYGPRFMSPDVEEHYKLVEVEGCAIPQYQLKPKAKRNLNVLKRRLNSADPNEIRWAIDAKLQDLADQDAAQSQSYRFDYEEETDKAEEDGYDPSTLIKVASYGDAIAVDGDLLVPPHIMKLLNLKPPKHRVMLWTEASKGANEDAWSAYYDHLRGTGYDRIDLGGEDPTGSSQQLSVDTIVDAVLDEWDVSDQGDKPTASEVQHAIAQYGIGSGDSVYWESSAGLIRWFAKLPAKAPASKRRSRMRALNAVGDRIMIISRGEYPSGYPGGAKAAWVDEGTVMDEITARDTGGVIQIKARMDDDDSVYTFRRDYGVGRAKGGGTIFDPAILMPYAWIVIEIDGQPAGATDYYEIRYLGKSERKSPKTRRDKMRGLNALKRRLTRV